MIQLHILTHNILTKKKTIMYDVYLLNSVSLKKSYDANMVISPMLQYINTQSK